MATGKRTEKTKADAKNYSRRDFLVGGGAVIAADALDACSPVAAAVTATQAPLAKASYAASLRSQARG